MATGTDEPRELETDVAEMVCHLADGQIDSVVMCTGGNTEAIKQQFRDALNKLIDERFEVLRRQLTLIRVLPPQVARPFVIEDDDAGHDQSRRQD